MTLARQRYADAVDAAARELGVDVGALLAARGARLGAAIAGTTSDAEVPCG